MEGEARQKLHDDMAIAETILSQAFKSQIRLELGEQSGLNERPYIHRLNMLHGSAQLPETVIMKQAAIRDDHDAYDPAALDGPAAQLFNEWAGLQFLGEVCSQPLPAPTFYGGDRERGFILMEDFGDGIRLDHALLGKDEVLAEKTVIALFQTIGRMHAQTIGKAARYQEIRAALGPTRKSITLYDEIDTWDKGIVRTSLDAIDIHPKPAFYNELDRVWETIKMSRYFVAYIHSDPCPDNCHWVSSNLRLLDFESGQYGHAFSDGAYARIPFHFCWCSNRLPEAIIKKAEIVYRTELIKGCPEAESNELFYAAFISICIYRVFNLFSYLFIEDKLFDKDIPWGISSSRQRPFMWFEHLVTMTEIGEGFQAINETAQNILERLQTLWPDTKMMPYYPVFRKKRAIGWLRRYF